MSHKTIDKRGRNHRPKAIVHPSPTTSKDDELIRNRSGEEPRIIQANADGSIKEVAPKEPEVLLLTPFPDGTCLKAVARPWPTQAGEKPADYDQSPQYVLLNSARQQLAIAKNAQVAALLCDGVNVLFAAQEQADQMGREVKKEADDLTDSIMRAKGVTK